MNSVIITIKIILKKKAYELCNIGTKITKMRNSQEK